MVYCAGKLMENLRLFYKSDRPHFLWVYRHDNPLEMLGERRGGGGGGVLPYKGLNGDVRPARVCFSGFLS